jgi:hypothetical protein
VEAASAAVPGLSIYFHDPDMPIYLLALYAKNERGDLSAREKKEFAEFVKEVARRWRRN